MQLVFWVLVAFLTCFNRIGALRCQRCADDQHLRFTFRHVSDIKCHGVFSDVEEIHCSGRCFTMHTWYFEGETRKMSEIRYCDSRAFFRSELEDKYSDNRCYTRKYQWKYEQKFCFCNTDKCNVDLDIMSGERTIQNTNPTSDTFDFDFDEIPFFTIVPLILVSLCIVGLLIFLWCA
ncbi:hypothetical protein L596_001966 [Steinernema carpocapsae]|uniref:Protein quiver n=1 Tax=Steinernema carpocapsae TaxID=34508 RepID=A0A4U5PK53_STECR|nr:hypothetical protein L596_027061 [Steinernema carpocapsae]TKR63243.1 hypothetical protein L596_027093 [Steinernema carpocapsae]TKR96856.1 hypothetical protein L596_010811 [Steinernema carpocapsae]TMS34344.1 hypothetical protein L596_001966 [Steinernema carpocapsae]